MAGGVRMVFVLLKNLVIRCSAMTGGRRGLFAIGGSHSMRSNDVVLVARSRIAGRMRVRTGVEGILSLILFLEAARERSSGWHSSFVLDEAVAPCAMAICGTEGDSA